MLLRSGDSFATWEKVPHQPYKGALQVILSQVISPETQVLEWCPAWSGLPYEKKVPH